VAFSLSVAVVYRMFWSGQGKLCIYISNGSQIFQSRLLLQKTIKSQKPQQQNRELPRKKPTKHQPTNLTTTLTSPNSPTMPPTRLLIWICCQYLAIRKVKKVYSTGCLYCHVGGCKHERCNDCERAVYRAAGEL